jgi:hypothetical protein
MKLGTMTMSACIAASALAGLLLSATPAEAGGSAYSLMQFEAEATSPVIVWGPVGSCNWPSA